MPGKAGRSGRLPDIGIADGTESTLPIEGDTKPAKPDFVSPEASEIWDVFTDQLSSMRRLRAEDAPLLQSACELWGLYRASYAAAHRNPTDKDSRIAVTSYWAKFEQAAARFGFNPADRQRLKVPPQQTGVRRRQA